jgi:hypothetical protein
MPPSAPDADRALLARWCSEHLGAQPAAELFRSGFLSAVTGVRLADGREVVVKVRPASPRIAACAEVQRRMFGSGYPCPEPLAGPAPFGGSLATAEAYVPGGAVLPDGGDPARRFAEALALLIRLAPRPAEVGSLEPPPSWAAWDHAEAGVWPRPEDDADLNAAAGPEWMDRAGRDARDRLRAGGSEPVIGHCDWLAGNLRWTGDRLLVVHDWDSAAADSEEVLAGFAAALYPADSLPDGHATVTGTERFLGAYGAARGRAFSAAELQRAWAAGVWTLAYDAKCEQVAGQPVVSLSEDEAAQRLRRAGIR